MELTERKSPSTIAYRILPMRARQTAVGMRIAVARVNPPLERKAIERKLRRQRTEQQIAAPESAQRRTPTPRG